MSGRKKDKAAVLQWPLLPSETFKGTYRHALAQCAYELELCKEYSDEGGDHVILLMSVRYVHRLKRGQKRTPILFWGYRNFSTTTKSWRFSFQKGNEGMD